VRGLEDDPVVRGTGSGHGWLEVRFPRAGLTSCTCAACGGVVREERRKASTDMSGFDLLLVRFSWFRVG
jgi:hypothetical protein